MSNFIVVSPGQSTNGGNSGDLFVFQSGAISGSTVLGGTGADTIHLLDPTSSASNTLFETKGGADVFNISGQTISGTIAGGAGGDTVLLSGANTLTDVRLGAGSDTIKLKGILSVNGKGSIQGGAGADTISAAAINNVLSGSTILMGAGKDTITLSGTFASGQMMGGGGADVFTFDSINAGAKSTIKGGAGGDTIDLAGNYTGTNVFLGDGSDNLTLSANVISLTGQFLGGAGADVISGNGESFLNVSGLTIGGGAGADVISLSEIGSAGEGARILGGGGNDSIALDANAGQSTAGMGFSAGMGFATIVGGAGADSITFDGLAAGTAGFAGVIAFSSLSDSTAASMDVITYSGTAGAEKAFLLDFDSKVVTGIAASKSKGGVTTNANGFLNNIGTNSSFSERMSALDALTVTGEIGLFKDASGDAYVFVQGGSTDLVARFNGTGSAGTVTLLEEANGEYRVNVSI
jgi:hypothetical protein